MTWKEAAFIAKAVQVGEFVITYDKDGTTMFAVHGDLVEFAPQWIAIRRDKRVLVFDRENSLTSTIQQDSWNKGMRPQVS